MIMDQNLHQPNLDAGDVRTPQAPVVPPRRKRIKLWWLFTLLGMIVVGFGLGLTAKVILSVNSTNSETGEKVVFFEQLKRLISSPDRQLQGESADRVNILLIGIGGEGHEGAYLADTIILASIKPSTKEVAMLSIPRDLYVDIPDYGTRKINNAMAFGQSDQYPGGGETLLSRVVSEVTGQPIHYFARIDFEGFKKAINDLGGVWVNVEQSFADYQYPTSNFGYQTIRFNEGLQKMDGDTALKFVRSRHGTNGEGSDFARSKRQQSVLLAAKEQGLSFQTLITPKRIIDALDDLGQHNRTNLQIWEIVRLGQLMSDLKQDAITTKVLDNSAEGLLESSTTQDGAYILLPRAGSYIDIQDLAKNIFVAQASVDENPRIEIQNGTKVSGLAAQAAQQLANSFTVAGISTAGNQNYETTTLIDLTKGAKPKSRERLQEYLKVQSTSTLPSFIANVDAPVNYDSLNQVPQQTTESARYPNVDFLVILGKDYASRLTNTP